MPLTDSHSPMAAPVKVKLFDLPNELHLEILQYLDFPFRVALSQSCSFFRARFKVTCETPDKQWSYYARLRNGRGAQHPPLDSTKSITMITWTAAYSDRKDDYFACHVCLKLCHRDKLYNGGPWIWHRRHAIDSTSRICFDCSEESRHYHEKHISPYTRNLVFCL